MAEQTPIPDEVKAKVLLESGFRCAVDGKPCSLKTAQIMPWHQADEYKVEDLICLCEACKEQVIKDRWNEEVLRGFKQSPWIARQSEDPQTTTKSTTRVRLTVETRKEDFDENEQRWLCYAIAAFLDILPQAVRIIKVKKGNFKVTIRLPTESAGKLLSAYKRQAPELNDFLAPIVISDLHQVLTARQKAASAFHAAGRKLANIWQWILENCFGFYGRLWLKIIIVAIFIGAAILSAILAIENSGTPFSALSAMAIAILFFCFLAADSWRFLTDLLFSTSNETLLLARRIDPEVDDAMNRVENRVKELKGEEQLNAIKFYAGDISSDYKSRVPYPRITGRFARHVIFNFVSTIFCFAILTIGLARIDAYCGASISTYGHDCFKDSTSLETLVHSGYYQYLCQFKL